MYVSPIVSVEKLTVVPVVRSSWPPLAGVVESTARTRYPVSADPPLISGALHETVTTPLLTAADATTDRGALGTVFTGVAATATDAVPAPAELVAFTVNE